MRVTRVLFAIVAVVAGPVGVVMLIAPDETHRYFAWPIGPPPAAAVVGGFYIASAIVFGWAALRADWPEARPLCIGVLALTIPTLIATINHSEVFDFGRWQAVAWLALFIASPIAYGMILVAQRGKVASPREQLRRSAPLVAALLAAAYSVAGIVLLSDPEALERPFRGVGLSARFLGCWALFLAALSVCVLLRDRWNESRSALLALTLLPLGACAGLLRTFDDLTPGTARRAYLVGLVLLAAVPGSLMVAAHRRHHRAPLREGHHS